MINIRSIRSITGLAVIGLALLAGNSPAQTTRATQSGTMSGTLPQSLRIPIGLSFKVRLKDSLNSRVVTPGAMWTGVLAEDFVGPQGRVYAVVGTTVTGIVASVQPGVDSLPASISLRAMSIDGVELYIDSRRASGSPFSAGGGLQTSGSNNLTSDHAGTSGSSSGFATSAASQQINLRSGTLLTFSTTPH
jgi:hypothetical protein